jgi:hypothetical protein
MAGLAGLVEIVSTDPFEADKPWAVHGVHLDGQHFRRGDRESHADQARQCLWVTRQRRQEIETTNLRRQGMVGVPMPRDVVHGEIIDDVRPNERREIQGT